MKNPKYKKWVNLASSNDKFEEKKLSQFQSFELKFVRILQISKFGKKYLCFKMKS